MKAKKFPLLQVLYQKIEQLKPYDRNARTHTDRQIKQIAESIRVFGFVNPVLVDRNNRVIAGHGRVEAARLLGMTEVPTIRLEDLSEEQIRAYVLTDNKLAENAGWDREILAVELQHLLTLDCADFDVTITGFEIGEIDAILEDATRPGKEDDFLEPVSGATPISEPGDLWLMGKHRIMCGNSLVEWSWLNSGAPGYMLDRYERGLLNSRMEKRSVFWPQGSDGKYSPVTFRA